MSKKRKYAVAVLYMRKVGGDIHLSLALNEVSASNKEEALGRGIILSDTDMKEDGNEGYSIQSKNVIEITP